MYGDLITYKVIKYKKKYKLKSSDGRTLERIYNTKEDADEYRRWYNAFHNREGDVAVHRPGQD